MLLNEYGATGFRVQEGLHLNLHWACYELKYSLGSHLVRESRCRAGSQCASI